MRAFLAAALLGAVAGPAVRADPPPASKEYRVKATYLFNFAKFVEWPPAVFAATNTPIAIGILGADNFGAFLDELLHGETIRGRALVVRRSREVGDLKACHIVFVSKSEEGRMSAILAELEGASLLTVGETGRFAENGGIAGFVLDGSKVRFEINPAAARRCGLKIEAQLLSLARVVGPAADKENK